jgi:hypothetical protein
MKLIGVISTAVLSLTLGVAAPAYAQQEHHDHQEEQKAKPAQDEKQTQPAKSAQQEEKPAAQQEKSTKPEEKTVQQAKPEQQAQRASGNGGGRIPATNSRPILDSNTRFGSAKPTTAITVSNTVAIRSDSLTRGQATGSIRRTFMLSKLTACITCATHRFLALTLRSASHHSGPSGVAWGRNQLNYHRRGSTLLARAGFFPYQQGDFRRIDLANLIVTFPKSEP